MVASFNEASYTSTSYTTEALVAGAGRGGGLGRIRKPKQQIRKIPEETLDFHINIFIQTVIVIRQKNKITISPTLRTKFEVPIGFQPATLQDQTPSLMQAKASIFKDQPLRIGGACLKSELPEYNILAKPNQTKSLDAEIRFEAYHGVKIIEVADAILSGEDLPEPDNSSFFTFNESGIQWAQTVQENSRFEEFNRSSSFVGNVRYDNETQEMTMILNGKSYRFCSVPRRKFEALRGAGSVGAEFNRIMKGQHDC